MFKNKFSLVLLILGLIALGTYTQIRKKAKNTKANQTKIKPDSPKKSDAPVDEVIAKAADDEERVERAAAYREFKNGRLRCSPLDGRAFCEFFKIPLDLDYGVIIHDKSDSFPFQTISLKAVANEAFEKAREALSKYSIISTEEKGFIALNFFLEKTLNREFLPALREYGLRIRIDETVGNEVKSSFYISIPPGKLENLLSFYDENIPKLQKDNDFSFFREGQDRFQFGVLVENSQRVAPGKR